MACICEVIIYNGDHIAAIYKVLTRVNIDVRLVTPYAAVASAGIDYYLIEYNNIRKHYPEITAPLFIDCGPYPGYAMASLRAGAQHIYVDIKETRVLNAIRTMSEKLNVQVYTTNDRPKHQVDLLSLQGTM
jgi:hypothetical protein